jgi:glucose-1-phosphate cytidylyltransferase
MGELSSPFFSQTIIWPSFSKRRRYMKVILFCGGMGMRLRDYSEIIPKPLVTIGRIPILLHIMKYYSYFGINDFILCLGYKADGIKKFFLNPDEYLSYNLHMGGGYKKDILNNDVFKWNISLIDTGLHANIGQRLKAVEEHLAGEEVFMANYSDVLTDLPLLDFLDFFEAQGSIAGFLGVRPYHTFHVVNIKNGGLVNKIQDARKANIWINGGYFIFRKEIYHYIRDGEELVDQPFQRLIGEKKLISYQYNGFWGCMDTFKDKQQLEELYNSGQAPWEVWKTASLVKHVHSY